MPFTRLTRMTPNLSFHIRTKRKTGPAMLYCRLSYNGQRTTEYKTGIQVEASQWPGLLESDPRTAPVRLRLAQFRADHDWLSLNLSDPTAEGIKSAWIAAQEQKAKPAPKSILLTDAYQQYVQYKVKPPGRKPAGWRPMATKTKDRLLKTADHLADFLRVSKTPRLVIADLKTSFGYSFADYLTDQGMNADSVSRHVYNVSDAMDHAARYDRIAVNPLSGVKIKGQPPRRIDFLTETDLIGLAGLKLKGIYDTVRNWALLMCYTGLDYHDALKVTANLPMYYRKTPDGDAIVFQRLKYDHAPAWGECHIPVLPVARTLLATVPKWKRPRLKVINTHLKKIGAALSLSFKMSAKICRKTAALVFLLYYENIYVVQKVMGHQSVKTTEKYYLNMPAEIVYRAMAKKKQTAIVKPA